MISKPARSPCSACDRNNLQSHKSEGRKGLLISLARRTCTPEREIEGGWSLLLKRGENAWPCRCLAPQLDPSWTSSERTFEHASRHRMRRPQRWGAVVYRRLSMRTLSTFTPRGWDERGSVRRSGRKGDRRRSNRTPPCRAGDSSALSERRRRARRPVPPRQD